MTDFGISGSKWPDPNLSYRITDYTSDMTQSDVDADIKKALDLWAEVTPLKFTQIYEGTANITMLFGSGEHGDGVPFDGPGNVLAHAWFAREFKNEFEGDVHFDDDETWSTGPGGSGK